MSNAPRNGRSKSEKTVAHFLRDLGIDFQYEQGTFITDDNGRPRVWSPDFYLPELGIYIEVCGSDSFDYNYRERTYQRNKIPVIFAHTYKEPKTWKNYLIGQIREIHTNRTRLIESFAARKQQ